MNGPIDDEIREYVRQNFKQAKQKRRVVLFIIDLVLVVFFSILAWGIALASEEWIAAVILMTVAAGLATLFHGLSALSETAHGDREIKRQLVMEARLKRALGGLDNSLDDIDVSDLAGESAKRKRAHLALPDDEEIDLEALGRPDAEKAEQGQRSSGDAR